MKILGIETSGTLASVALLNTETNQISEINITAAKTHSTTLIPMIHALLDLSGVPLDDIDVIAVDTGPGSYTGIRIGIACVKGLVLSRKNIRVSGVSNLTAAAFTHGDKSFVKKEARTGTVYCGVYDEFQNPVVPDCVLSEIEFENLREKYKDFQLIEANEPYAKDLCKFAFAQGCPRTEPLNAAYLEPTKAEKETQMSEIRCQKSD
ncbi:MAG: tRNA (adenosine(37)-N6)-threonylcarbamoyltransferase complex dimerization subunit type 1 TsaB [Ruminococcus sp.]|nr:tRNA (adenosine(37)-N6)-threonylcarbamoyltransferase complex dimerization subunit type 1 TsaB [Ruminococcus sp.]